MALCIWAALGRCTAQPGDAQEQCQTCAADFHSVCATSGVRALFQGNEALQDVSAHCCGRCGQWERPADPGEVALAAEPQAMEAAASAEAPEESLICDPTKLEVVTQGRYPSMDLVRCCVPSCGHATGEGLRRDFVAAHFMAASLAGTHGAYTVLRPAKRPRSAAPPGPAVLAQRKEDFFVPSSLQRRAPGATPEAEDADAAGALDEVTPMQESEEPAATHATPPHVQLDAPLSDAPPPPPPLPLPLPPPPPPAPPPPAPAPALPPGPTPPPFEGGWDMVHRLLLAILTAVRGVPALVVAALQALSEKKKEAAMAATEAAAAARLKGNTLDELAVAAGFAVTADYRTLARRASSLRC